MAKTLRLAMELSDDAVNKLEAIKAFFISEGSMGITNETPLEAIVVETVRTGVAAIGVYMMRDDTWDRCMDEVELGNAADRALE